MKRDRVYRIPRTETVFGHGTMYAVAEPEPGKRGRFAGALIHDGQWQILPVEGCPLCLRDHLLTAAAGPFEGPVMLASCETNDQDAGVRLIGVSESVLGLMRESEVIRGQLLRVLPSLASVL